MGAGPPPPPWISENYGSQGVLKYPTAPPPRKVKKVKSFPSGKITPACFALYNHKLIS